MLGAKELGDAFKSRKNECNLFSKQLMLNALIFELRTQALAGILEQTWLKMLIFAGVLILDN
jgi:hypothetical protein